MLEQVTKALSTLFVYRVGCENPKKVLPVSLTSCAPASTWAWVRLPTAQSALQAQGPSPC